MSRIRSSGSKIEKTLGKAIWDAGLRYRKQYKNLPGKPDYVLVSKKIAIFCDSAFWHGYKKMTTKIHKFQSNKSFWNQKITRNIERDNEVNRELKSRGWVVIRFWDFQILNETEKCVEKILKEVRKKL